MTVLGHLERGGSLMPFDRIVGTRSGMPAADLVAKRQFGRMVYPKAGKMDSVSIDGAWEKMKYTDPDHEIVPAARVVRATFGDST